jgi:hypothetical protein
MTITWGGIAHHDNNHMFASTNGLAPTRKEPGIAEPCAPTHLIGISERLGHTRSMLREQIRMALGDMLFPLLG